MWVYFDFCVPKKPLKFLHIAGFYLYKTRQKLGNLGELVNLYGLVNIEIDNDKRGVIGDFTPITDIRITKAER